MYIDTRVQNAEKCSPFLPRARISEDMQLLCGEKKEEEEAFVKIPLKHYIQTNFFSAHIFRVYTYTIQNEKKEEERNELFFTKSRVIM